MKPGGTFDQSVPTPHMSVRQPFHIWNSVKASMTTESLSDTTEFITIQVGLCEQMIFCLSLWHLNNTGPMKNVCLVDVCERRHTHTSVEHLGPDKVSTVCTCAF